MAATPGQALSPPLDRGDLWGFFEVENEVENPCRQPQKVVVYLGYFMMREMDSNPRSPRKGTTVSTLPVRTREPLSKLAASYR